MPLAHIEYIPILELIVKLKLYRNVVHILFSTSSVELEPLMFNRVVVYMYTVH